MHDWSWFRHSRLLPRLLSRSTACVGRSGTPKWRFSPVSIAPRARFFICTTEHARAARQLRGTMKSAGHPPRAGTHLYRLLHARGVRDLVHGLRHDGAGGRSPGATATSNASTPHVAAHVRRRVHPVHPPPIGRSHSVRWRGRRARPVEGRGRGDVPPPSAKRPGGDVPVGRSAVHRGHRAIGMGLNMDINHVAFGAVRKFDGRSVRDLTSGGWPRLPAGPVDTPRLAHSNCCSTRWWLTTSPSIASSGPSDRVAEQRPRHVVDPCSTAWTVAPSTGYPPPEPTHDVETLTGW